MRWFPSDAGLKVVSLVLATFTWFFVKGITSDSRVIDGVPVEVKARPGLTILQTSAATITVTVRGTPEDIRQVSRQDLSAVVDLTDDTRLGPITKKLTPRSVRHSRRVQIAEIDPAEVTVGVAVMSVMLVFLARGKIRHNDFIKLENTGLYWHLVDVIWIFLLPLFYLAA